MSQIKVFLLGHKYIVLFSILLFAGMYALNYYFPITLDDWTYSMTEGRKIGFADIIPYQYVHYYQWGGRSVVHAIAQFLLASGVFWGDVINSIGYVALVLVIYYITNKSNKQNISLFIGINILIWFLTPALIENIFWITGSANYMWGTLLILLFISFYCSAFLTQKTNDGWGKGIGLFLFGIVAGWTNENMAVAMIFFIICLILLMRKEKQALPKWMLFGLVGAIIGCAFMLLAPGNYIRSAGEINALNAGNEEPMYMFYFYRFTNILKMSSWYALIPTVIYGITLLLYLKYRREKNRKILLISLLFAVTAGVGTLAMTAAPSFPTRVWFAILIFLFIATGLLFANLDFSLSYIKWPTYVVVAAFTVLFLYSYWLSAVDFRRIHGIWVERDSIVLTEKEKGVKDIVIYGRFKASDSWLVRPKTGDIPLDSISWMQNAYGQYMGVNSVKIFDKENK